MMRSTFVFCVLVCAFHFVFTTPRNISITKLDTNPDHNETNFIMKAAPTRNRTRLSGSMFPAKGSGVFSNMFLRPVDCEELLQLGYNRSGVYSIWPRNKLLDGKRLQVFCDMETDKGGWTVLQRRGNFLRPKNYFFRDWADYKIGFGDIERDFWLGNDNIFALTNQRLYSARIDLTDVDGNYRYALYDIFYIDSENNKYMLTIKDYSGTANDSMIASHSGQKFSTKDQDNDSHTTSCATMYKGGWWYSACHSANLNGLYHTGKHETFADGVNWKEWKGYHESLDKTEIKIRPKNFRKTLV